MKPEQHARIFGVSDEKLMVSLVILRLIPLVPYNMINYGYGLTNIRTSYRIPRTKLTVGGGVSAQSKTKSLYNVKQGGYGLIDGFVQYEFGPNAKLNLMT